MLRLRHLAPWLRTLVLSLALYAASSCERVELGNDSYTKSKERTDTPTDTTLQSPYSVAEAQLHAGRKVAVLGYIVGAIEGMSISKATFAPPFATESNLLLADTPHATQADQCLPIALPANTNIRTELNLKHNPQHLGTRVLVVGTITPYFQRLGIRQPIGYQPFTPTPPPPPTPPIVPRDTLRTIVYPKLDSTRTDTLISRMPSR